MFMQPETVLFCLSLLHSVLGVLDGHCRYFCVCAVCQTLFVTEHSRQRDYLVYSEEHLSALLLGVSDPGFRFYCAVEERINRGVRKTVGLAPACAYRVADVVAMRDVVPISATVKPALRHDQDSWQYGFGSRRDKVISA